MSLAALIRGMAAAGAPPEAIALAVEAIEQRDAKDEARRAQARDKKRRQRGTVPGLSRDTVGTVPAETPSLDKEIPPRPPKEINPIPVCDTLTRKAAGFGPPSDVEPQLWNEFCAQRKKPLSQTSFARIETTLAEAAQVGWPPGEIIARSIASGWETVFIPKEPRNGIRPANDRNFRPSARDRSSEIDDAARTLGFG